MQFLHKLKRYAHSNTHAVFHVWPPSSTLTPAPPPPPPPPPSFSPFIRLPLQDTHSTVISSCPHARCNFRAACCPVGYVANLFGLLFFYLFYHVFVYVLLFLLCVAWASRTSRWKVTKWAPSALRWAFAQAWCAPSSATVSRATRCLTPRSRFAFAFACVYAIVCAVGEEGDSWSRGESERVWEEGGCAQLGIRSGVVPPSAGCSAQPSRSPGSVPLLPHHVAICVYTTGGILHGGRGARFAPPSSVFYVPVLVCVAAVCCADRGVDVPHDRLCAPLCAQARQAQGSLELGMDVKLRTGPNPDGLLPARPFSHHHLCL